MGFSTPKPQKPEPAPKAPTREEAAPKGRPDDELRNAMRRTGIAGNVFTSSLGLTSSAKTGGSASMLGMVK